MTHKELAEKIEFIENNPGASFWIKRAWRDLKERDIVDALEDVELLVDVLLAKWHKGYTEQNTLHK